MTPAERHAYYAGWLRGRAQAADVAWRYADELGLMVADECVLCVPGLTAAAETAGHIAAAIEGMEEVI